MDDVEKITQRLTKETGLTSEDIQKKVSKRKEKTHGLLSDYGALYAIAKEHGVDLNGNTANVTPIKDVKPSNSVSIYGRVKAVYSAKEFRRKDNTVGRFASVVIVDGTGDIRVVLWDNNTDIIKSLRVGDALFVRNGYVKDNRGVVEVHAGSLSALTVNPPFASTLPDVDENLIKVEGIREGVQSLNLRCRVGSYSPKTTFQRSDGSSGSRASFIAEDETGKIRVVLWDQCADTPLVVGEFVNLENAYVRRGLSGELEVHAGNRSRIVKSDKKIVLPEIETKENTIKVSGITPDLRGFSSELRVIKVYRPREYSGGKVSSLVAGDNTGTIRVVLWDEKAELADQLAPGDGVLLQNIYSKSNLNNEPEIHVGKYGNLLKDNSLVVPTLSELEEKLTREKRVADVDLTDDRVKITGRIVDFDETRPLLYMTCPSCDKRVQDVGGAYVCDTCGEITPNINLVVSATLEDDSGSIRAVFFKDNAEKILGLGLADVLSVISQTQDNFAPLYEAKSRLLNKSVSLVGRAKYNEFSDQLELIVERIL